MSASKQDLAQLHGILTWVKGSKGPANAALRERHLVEGLERAIALLEKPEAKATIIAFVLRALYDSVRKSPTMPDIWIVHDRGLYAWAMEQIQVLMLPEVEHDPIMIPPGIVQ